MSRYTQGYFRPKNPKKYQGDSNNIVFRSSWEMRCMTFFDENPNILRWASEEIVIPYVDPMTGKRRRYFPDFLIECVQKDGNKKIVMIEVKPHAQTQPPKKQKRQTRRYIQEVHTYGVNENKWKAAQKYCSAKGWDFQVWTEKNMKFT